MPCDCLYMCTHVRERGVCVYLLPFGFSGGSVSSTGCSTGPTLSATRKVWSHNLSMFSQSVTMPRFIGDCTNSGAWLDLRGANALAPTNASGCPLPRRDLRLLVVALAPALAPAPPPAPAARAVAASTACTAPTTPTTEGTLAAGAVTSADPASPALIHPLPLSITSGTSSSETVAMVDLEAMSKG